MYHLHDPHTTAEPVLVASGLTFLVPAYMAYLQNQKYFSGSLVFLTFTTVGFHGTRNEYFFILDIAAILNYIIYNTYYNFLNNPPNIIFVNLFSIGYSLLSYFAGKKYNVMSFDPDWNIQMFFHSLMHLFATYGAYKSFTNS